MTFLYSLDTTPPPVVAPNPPLPALGLTGGILTIYARVCGGACDSSDNVAFNRFSDAAAQLYDATDPRTQHVAQLGNSHGVSENLSP